MLDKKLKKYLAFLIVFIFFIIFIIFSLIYFEKIAPPLISSIKYEELPLKKDILEKITIQFLKEFYPHFTFEINIHFLKNTYQVDFYFEKEKLVSLSFFKSNLKCFKSEGNNKILYEFTYNFREYLKTTTKIKLY